MHQRTFNYHSTSTPQPMPFIFCDPSPSSLIIVTPPRLFHSLMAKYVKDAFPLFAQFSHSTVFCFLNVTHETYMDRHLKCFITCQKVPSFEFRILLQQSGTCYKHGTITKRNIFYYQITNFLSLITKCDSYLWFTRNDKKAVKANL